MLLRAAASRPELHGAALAKRASLQPSTAAVPQRVVNFIRVVRCGTRPSSAIRPGRCWGCAAARPIDPHEPLKPLSKPVGQPRLPVAYAVHPTTMRAVRPLAQAA